MITVEVSILSLIVWVLDKEKGLYNSDLSLEYVRLGAKIENNIEIQLIRWSI